MKSRTSLCFSLMTLFGALSVCAPGPGPSATAQEKATIVTFDVPGAGTGSGQGTFALEINLAAQSNAATLTPRSPRTGSCVLATASSAHSTCQVQELPTFPGDPDGIAGEINDKGLTQGTFPNGVAHLDELEILVVVDNETDTLSSIDQGVPQVPEIIQLAARCRPAANTRARTASVFSTSCVVAVTGFRS